MVTMGSSNWTGLCRAYQAPLWQVGMLTEAMPPLPPSDIGDGTDLASPSRMEENATSHHTTTG